MRSASGGGSRRAGRGGRLSPWTAGVGGGSSRAGACWAVGRPSTELGGPSGEPVPKRSEQEAPAPPLRLSSAGIGRPVADVTLQGGGAGSPPPLAALGEFSCAGCGGGERRPGEGVREAPLRTGLARWPLLLPSPTCWGGGGAGAAGVGGRGLPSLLCPTRVSAKVAKRRVTCSLRAGACLPRPPACRSVPGRATPPHMGVCVSGSPSAWEASAAEGEAAGIPAGAFLGWPWIASLSRPAASRLLCLPSRPLGFSPKVPRWQKRLPAPRPPSSPLPNPPLLSLLPLLMQSRGWGSVGGQDAVPSPTSAAQAEDVEQSLTWGAGLLGAARRLPSGRPALCFAKTLGPG